MVARHRMLTMWFSRNCRVHTSIPEKTLQLCDFQKGRDPQSPYPLDPHCIVDENQLLLKNIYDFNTAGEWDCVTAEECLPALHYSVDFIFLSLGIMNSNVEFWNH